MQRSVQKAKFSQQRDQEDRCHYKDKRKAIHPDATSNSWRGVFFFFLVLYFFQITWKAEVERIFPMAMCWAADVPQQQ